jgi:RNA polymerase-binding transcription factor DksA
MENELVRYSDAELDEFKVLIETKLERASTHLSGLQEQILEITENTSDEHGGDWVDDSSINNDVEMLNNMAIRQRVYIQDLQNALVRIKNKTYGICSLTGQLIDKRRLLAVPTTTKSLAAKVAEQVPTPERKERVEIEKPVVEKKPLEKKSTEKRITSTIIRKSSPGKKKPVEIEAIQLTEENVDKIMEFCGDKIKSHPFTGVVIETLEGNMTADKGDYIIKGVKGEFYPCKPDIFELTYEKV